MDERLQRLRSALVDDLRVQLGPEAFQRHRLISIRFHRAARLNVPNGTGDKKAWCAYFDAHFPRGGERAS